MGSGIRSNSDIFADRGDPWVSDKEGRTEYGRIERTENPEFDSYFTKKASLRVEPKSEVVTDNTRDRARRMANAALKAHANMRKARKSDIPRIAEAGDE